MYVVLIGPTRCRLRALSDRNAYPIRGPKCVPYSWPCLFSCASFLACRFSWARDRLRGLHFRQHLEASERRPLPLLPQDFGAGTLDKCESLIKTMVKIKKKVYVLFIRVYIFLFCQDRVMHG
jgi:hypothetical protein